MTIDYMIYWVTFSHVQATLRNLESGQQRIYLVDSSYHTINQEGTYWEYMFENIVAESSEDRKKIFMAIKEYFLATANYLFHTVCQAMNRAKLDEAESVALLVLLFTNPTSQVTISDETRNILKGWKDQTLKGIGDHIDRTGRNVDERMGEIIFLMTEFQVKNIRLVLILCIDRVVIEVFENQYEFSGVFY